MFSDGETAAMDMHPSAVRLYEAASVLKKTHGQSAVARLLNASPQTVKHWEKRGVSKEGAILAQKIMGVLAYWLLYGQGPMTQPEAEATPANGLGISAQLPPAYQVRPVAISSEVLVERLADLLDSLPESAQATAQNALQALSVAPDSAKVRAALVRALSAADDAPGKQHSNAA